MAASIPKKASLLYGMEYPCWSVCVRCEGFLPTGGAEWEKQKALTLWALLSNNHAGVLSNTVSVTNPKYSALQAALKKTISIPDRPSMFSNVHTSTKVNFYVCIWEESQ